MQHRDHGSASAGAGDQAAQQRALVRCVQVRGGFVQQQHRRTDGQRARQQHPLALAAGELAQAALRKSGALGLGHRRIHRGLVDGVGRAQQAVARQAAQANDLARGDVAIALALLRQPGQLLRTLAQRPVRQGPALQQHLPGIRHAQPRQQLQQAALARAVGADDGHPLATAQAQRDMIDDGAATQVQRQLLGLDHASRPRCRSSTSR